MGKRLEEGLSSTDKGDFDLLRRIWDSNMIRMKDQIRLELNVPIL